MIRIFQILAVIFACVAAYFLWQGNKDAVFVTSVLAACALFLSIRFQAKGRLVEHETARSKVQEQED
jgi:hypothetical protein